MESVQIYAVIKPKKGEFISFLTVIRFGHIYQALGQTGGEDRTVVTWIVNSDLLRSLFNFTAVSLASDRRPHGGG